MNRKSLYLVIIFVVLFFTSRANWTSTVTGIQDNFNAVYFSNMSGFQNYGMIAGDNGWYYTQSGAAGTWVRFNISGNTADSLIYNHSQFYKVSSGLLNNLVHIVGKDTVSDNAVIFTFDLNSLAYTIEYLGPSGSHLNSILVRGTTIVYACGNNGLIVRKYGVGPYAIVPSTNSADLYTIAYASANQILFSGNEVFLNGDETGILNLTVYNAPGKFFKASVYNANNYFLAGNGYSRMQPGPLMLVDIDNYDFGPLNCTGLVRGNSCIYATTDHGIFRTMSNNSTILEYQPSSNSANLNDVYFLNSASSAGYACGDNSILLTTTNGGGYVKPYCSFNSNGSCAGSNLNIPGTWGSGTSCIWKIDNVQVSAACTLNYVINTPGVYQIDYIVYNNISMLSDTATQIINVVNTPSVNLQVTINDSILCKSQPLEITLQNTQTNTDYDFRRITSVNSYGTGTGNGGVLSFYSDTGLVTDTYHIYAMSTVANCTAYLTTLIPLIVEKTESSFHTSLINAEPGEPVSFFATSFDTQNYEWSFGTSALNPTSNLQNVLNNSFSTTGSPNIQLISSSANGCIDTLMVNNLAIYNEPLIEDTCWAFNNDEIDLPWNGYYTNRIYQSSPAQNGFLVCGTFNEQLLNSRYGISPPRFTGGGAYLAKYSYNGALKWFINSYDSLYESHNFTRPRFSSVVSDADGNIYATGISYGYSYFTDNTGNKVQLSYNPNTNNAFDYNSFIVKFDVNGKYIWSTQIKSGLPSQIIVDSNNDIVLIGTTLNNSWYCNQSVVDTFTNSNFPFSYANQYVLKIDTSGNFLWSAHLLGLSTNDDFTIRNVGSDDQNNIYISGHTQYNLVFCDAGQNGNQADSLSIVDCSYIVKYNSGGTYQWKTILTQLPVNGATIPYCNNRSISVDTSGYVYATGRVRLDAGDSLSISCPSGNINNVMQGEYYLLKLNNSGEYIWSTGISGSDAAWGYSVFTSGEDVYTIGNVQNDTNINLSWTGQLYSTDGNHQNLTIGKADMFISRYDSAGVLNYVAKTGNNAYVGAIVNETGSIFINPDNQVLFTFDIDGSPITPLTYFNSTFAPNGFDGLIGKLGTIPCNLNTAIPDEPDNITQSIRVYPNPTNSLLNISISGSNDSYNMKTIKLFNVMGSLLYKKESSLNEISVDLQSLKLTSNIYFVTIESGNNIFNRKVIYVCPD